MMAAQVKIEKNSVQETLVLPLYAKAYCVKQYPDLFHDEDCVRICDGIDYDFSQMDDKIHSLSGKISALSAAIRQYSIVQAIKEYLTDHPHAAIVNLGCGLDTAGHQADTGSCTFYNIDFANVIALREQLLPKGNREINIACDINDFSWFDQIQSDSSRGAVFFACGVFMYCSKTQVKKLTIALAQRFPGGELIFDGENRKGIAMDKKIIEASGIAPKDLMELNDPENELSSFSSHIASVQSTGLMSAYRKPDKRFGVVFRIMARYADHSHMSQLNRIYFK